MFIENPIFGIPVLIISDMLVLKNFYISKWSCTTHPHSITFQVLAEIGILPDSYAFLVYLVILYINL